MHVGIAKRLAPHNKPPAFPLHPRRVPMRTLCGRFLHGDDEERNSLFKMIPRIAEGSWVIKQSVGTTPVIMGRKLKTTYHITPKYVEVAVDVGSSSTAQYVTGMVSGGEGLLCTGELSPAARGVC